MTTTADFADILPNAQSSYGTAVTPQNTDANVEFVSLGRWEGAPTNTEQLVPREEATPAAA